MTVRVPHVVPSDWGPLRFRQMVSRGLCSQNCRSRPIPGRGLGGSPRNHLARRGITKSWTSPATHATRMVRLGIVAMLLLVLRATQAIAGSLLVAPSSGWSVALLDDANKAIIIGRRNISGPSW